MFYKTSSVQVEEYRGMPYLTVSIHYETDFEEHSVNFCYHNDQNVRRILSEIKSPRILSKLEMDLTQELKKQDAPQTKRLLQSLITQVNESQNVN